MQSNSHLNYINNVALSSKGEAYSSHKPSVSEMVIGQDYYPIMFPHQFLLKILDVGVVVGTRNTVCYSIYILMINPLNKFPTPSGLRVIYIKNLFCHTCQNIRVVSVPSSVTVHI